MNTERKVTISSVIKDDKSQVQTNSLSRGEKQGRKVFVSLGQLESGQEMGKNLPQRDGN